MKTGFNFQAGHSEKVTTAKATLSQKELAWSFVIIFLQKTLYQRLTSKYGKDNVHTEQPSGVGTVIDVVVKMKNEYWFYEIKTALTPRACLREATGQLLEYGFWPGAQPRSRLDLSSWDRVWIDDDGRNYLRRLRKRFSLPITYEAIVNRSADEPPA